MATIIITVLFEFSASHRLYRADLSNEQNRKLYGKCSNPNGHGHNYTLEVSVSGAIDPSTDMVIDAGVIKEIVEREIVSDVDHKDLNRDTPWLEGQVPTTEVVARAIFERLSHSFNQYHSAVALEAITLRETRRISVTVTR